MKSIFAVIAILTLYSGCFTADKEVWKTKTVYQVLTDRIWRDDDATNPCPELGKYCGGTWKGIEKQLDYIQNMGFDAIWISPVVKNVDTPYNYHGYSASDFTKLNEHFGDEKDFQDLVDAIHNKGMLIMVDVVANHVGPVDLDFSTIVPFNKPEHYHEKCQINGDDWDHNQWRVEHCRLVNLPDLAQENSFVRKTLLSWITGLVSKYGIDGLRVDTVPEVSHDFWSEFAQASGVYTIGECYNGNEKYVASYQQNLDGLFNYPMFFTQNDVYVWGKSAYALRERWNAEQTAFLDIDALGLFADNHDQPRFLHLNKSWNRLKNCLAFVFFARGIPFLYYGTEQGYSGGSDPANREQLWTNINPNHELYKFVQKLNQIRKQEQIWAQEFIERYVDDGFYAFSRGKVLVVTTNQDDDKLVHQLPYIPYQEGETVCNIFWEGDCLKVLNGNLTVVQLKGEVKIFLPASEAQKIWDLKTL